MPCANFLMMTAAAPARKPVGMLSNSMKRRSDMWVARHVLSRSIHPLSLSLNTVSLVFSAAKIEKSNAQKKKK